MLIEVCLINLGIICSCHQYVAILYEHYGTSSNAKKHIKCLYTMSYIVLEVVFKDLNLP